MDFTGENLEDVELNKGADHSQRGVNEALTAEAHVDGFQVDPSVI